MILYLDTSSLVKLYHQEEGTDQLSAYLEQGVNVIRLSEITLLEFRSALWKKVRTGEIAKKHALSAISCFVSDADNFQWIALDSRVLKEAANLIMKYGDKGLRTLDSLQLACALSMRGADSVFATADVLLRGFFIAEGLELVP